MWCNEHNVNQQTESYLLYLRKRGDASTHFPRLYFHLTSSWMLLWVWKTQASVHVPNPSVLPRHPETSTAFLLKSSISVLPMALISTCSNFKHFTESQLSKLLNLFLYLYSSRCCFDATTELLPNSLWHGELKDAQHSSNVEPPRSDPTRLVGADEPETSSSSDTSCNARNEFPPARKKLSCGFGYDSIQRWYDHNDANTWQTSSSLLSLVTSFWTWSFNKHFSLQWSSFPAERHETH